MDRAVVIAEVDDAVVADHRRRLDGAFGAAFPFDAVGDAADANELALIGCAPPREANTDVDVAFGVDDRRAEHLGG